MKSTLLFGIILGIISWNEEAAASPIQEMDNQLSCNIRGFFDSWSKVASESADNNNIVTSPTSAWLALAMTSRGSSGSTKNEIQNALRLSSADDKAIKTIQQIVQEFREPQDVSLKIANNFFLQDGIKIKQKFLDEIQQIFKSEVQAINFEAKDKAIKSINDWVESKTNNRIKNLVNEEDIKKSKLFLANAIYFKGEWKSTFDNWRTGPKPFYVNSSVTKNVEMISQSHEFLYGSFIDIKAQFVVLPYKNEDFNMVVIIPNDNNGLKTIESKVRAGEIEFDEILTSGNKQKLRLSMPKFKIESSIDMELILKKMGITKMFGDEADFSAITDQPELKIGKAIQKTFISVNEIGSEASVATGIKLSPLASVDNSMELIINRPFLFSIIMNGDNVRHELFRGRVIDPHYE